MNITNSDNDKNTLLVADDDWNNLTVVKNYLQSFNYNVQTVQDGSKVLVMVSQSKPVLILLDVLMPKLNGFETCRRLKANEDTCDIPVIFMTGVTKKANKVKAFEAGAADYVPKPVQYDELLARIRVHMTLRRVQTIFQEQNAAIEQQNLDLQRQNRELDIFSQFVVRDLKNPLAKQFASTQTLMGKLSRLPDGESLKFFFIRN